MLFRAKPKRKVNGAVGARGRSNAKRRPATQSKPVAPQRASSSEDDNSDVEFNVRSSSSGSDAEYYRGSKWQMQRSSKQAVRSADCMKYYIDSFSV